MNYLIQILNKLEKYFLFLAFLTMVFSSFIQVLNRNIFEIPMPGIEEVAKYCMVYVVMLGTEMGLRDGTQIRVTVLVDKLGEKMKNIINVFVGIVLIVFSLAMLKESIVILIQQVVSGQTSPGLKLPMYIPYFSLTLGFFIIFVTQLYSVFSLIKCNSFCHKELPWRG
ncbi:TRAP transporter small permease [Vibrio litoralis]|uniref:TRAP transporter small permease n=1 Tax=Vibrio litoralis TaxID=335972 RepID=UPI0004018774|nr:TRAP transporter small permease [Vibrio litoralis]